MSDAMSDDKAKPARPAAAAARALAEAAARRQAIDAKVTRMAKEVDGRDGPEPTRYEDWEVNGIAKDF